jgi:hypothetical protein
MTSKSSRRAFTGQLPVEEDIAEDFVQDSGPFIIFGV